MVKDPSELGQSFDHLYSEDLVALRRTKHCDPKQTA